MARKETKMVAHSGVGEMVEKRMLKVVRRDVRGFVVATMPQ